MLVLGEPDSRETQNSQCPCEEEEENDEEELLKQAIALSLEAGDGM